METYKKYDRELDALLDTCVVKEDLLNGLNSLMSRVNQDTEHSGVKEQMTVLYAEIQDIYNSVKDTEAQKHDSLDERIIRFEKIREQREKEKAAAFAASLDELFEGADKKPSKKKKEQVR